MKASGNCCVVLLETRRLLVIDPDVLEIYPVALPLVIEVVEAAWLRYDSAE